MLVAQKVALDIARQVAPLLNHLSSQDRHLADQIRRATASIVLNLAEGNCRTGRDRLHHFRIANGSRAEVDAAIHLAIAFEQVAPESAGDVLASLDHLAGMIYGLLRARRPMRSRKEGI